MFVRIIKLLGIGLVALALAAGNSGQAQMPQARMLLSVISLSEPQAHGQPPCTVTLKPGESIQRAIDQAPPGAVICLGSGTYRDNLTIKKGLTLRGTGAKPEEVRIVGKSRGYPVMRIESEHEIEVKLENLTAAEAKGYRCAMEDPQRICPDGVQALGKAKAVIRNVRVSGNWRDGLRVGGSAKVSLTNSQVSGNRFDGLSVWDSATVSLTNSKVSGNGWHGLRVWGSAKVEIKEGIINDNEWCGLFVYSHEAQVLGTPNMMRGNGADLCGFAPAYLRQPLVPPDPRQSLAVPADYATVQQAIDAIAPGGTIEIAAGIYDVGLTIWKPVVLRGAGLAKTILQALPERGLVLSIIAGVQGVRIEGLQVRGSEEEGLLIYGREVTIQGALISNNRWHSLKVVGSATVSLTNSQVSDNGYDGLFVGGSAKVTLTNSQVSGNFFGLFVEGSATVSLANSKVSANRRCGLFVGGSAKVTLTSSTVSSNELGLFVGGSAEVSLTNSQVSDNWAGLSVVGSAEVSLTNSTVSDNRYDGLSVWDSATAEVRSSTIEGNGTHPECQKLDLICNGIEVQGKSQTTITDSKIINNTDWGVAAWLKKCGYDGDDFRGRLVFQGTNVIEGNNKSGNHKGNPGNHPWNRPDVPDGQVCLP